MHISFKKKKPNKTLLHLACEYGHLQIVKFLVTEKLFNINSTTCTGKSPLFYACKKDHFEIVKFLVQKNAMLDTVEQKFRTPLHIACLTNNFDIAKLLLENGACKTKQTKNFKNTPLHLVCIKKNLAIAMLLLQNSSPLEKAFLLNTQNKNGKTPMHIATENKRLDFVRLFVKNGANLNIKDQNEDTALSIACKKKSKNIARFLIAQKADLNTRNNQNRAPIDIACRKKLKSLVRHLVNAGAATESGPKTPFNIAADEVPQYRLSCFLVDQGCCFFEKDSHSTPLLNNFNLKEQKKIFAHIFPVKNRLLVDKKNSSEFEFVTKIIAMQDPSKAIKYKKLDFSGADEKSFKNSKILQDILQNYLDVYLTRIYDFNRPTNKFTEEQDYVCKTIFRQTPFELLQSRISRSFPTTKCEKYYDRNRLFCAQSIFTENKDQLDLNHYLFVKQLQDIKIHFTKRTELDEKKNTKISLGSLISAINFVSNSPMASNGELAQQQIIQFLEKIWRR